MSENTTDGASKPPIPWTRRNVGLMICLGSSLAVLVWRFAADPTETELTTGASAIEKHYESAWGISSDTLKSLSRKD